MWSAVILFPPKACLHVACVVQQKDARQWFAELSVDMDKVRDALFSKMFIRQCFGVEEAEKKV